MAGGESLARKRQDLHDLILLRTAVLVLAGFAAALGECPLAFGAVLDAHRSVSGWCLKDVILAASKHIDENAKRNPARDVIRVDAFG
jgi:hypothetical protein